MSDQFGGDGLAVGQVSAPTTAGGIIVLKGTASRQYVTLKNLGPNTVFIGPTSGVTTVNGHALEIHDQCVLRGYRGDIYAIAVTAASTLSFAEERRA